MSYWLCITTEENWKVIKQKNVWGVSECHKNTIAKVKPGDYLKQERDRDKVIEPRIVAVYEAISEAFRDSKRIFRFPSRHG